MTFQICMPLTHQTSHELTNECLFTNDNTRRTGGHTLHKMQRATSTNAMTTKDELYIAALWLFLSQEPITMEHCTNSLTSIR